VDSYGFEMYTSNFFVHLRQRLRLVESNKKARLAENYLAISNVIFAVYIILTNMRTQF
jgi:hypothetical protein